jgi:hypothetical protein
VPDNAVTACSLILARCQVSTDSVRCQQRKHVAITLGMMRPTKSFSIPTYLILKGTRLCARSMGAAEVEKDGSFSTIGFIFWSLSNALLLRNNINTSSIAKPPTSAPFESSLQRTGFASKKKPTLLRRTLTNRLERGFPRWRNVLQDTVQNEGHPTDSIRTS